MKDQKLNNNDHNLGDKIISGTKIVWNVVKWPLVVVVGAIVKSKLPHNDNKNRNG